MTTVAKVYAKAHNVLTGPFVWVPNATSFYEDHTVLLAVLLALYLPVIFGIKVRECDESGLKGTRESMENSTPRFDLWTERTIFPNAENGGRRAEEANGRDC